MIFTSLKFLGFFIILLSLMGVFRGDKSRLYLLIIASYVFYGAWNPSYLILIFLCSLWGWGFGLLMSKAQTLRAKRFYLFISIFLSLSMLGYYKYTGFFYDNFAKILNIELKSIDILLPVGISFFTFQTMSYTIDLYRGRIDLCKSFPRFMLFVAFFPQLVAGPIVRASDFLPQLDRHIKLNAVNIISGAQIFLGGALQKVLIADNLSIFVDKIFLEPELYSSSTLWLALVSYSIQIFCDFSGYSLMAIGIAKILGFELPENFRMPYISRSITEFWRRWHISLSFWLRDYLYISLGGNRKGEIHTRINLMVTMLLGGLWHGASWNFVLWGGLHGLGLILHKYWSGWDISLRDTLIYRCAAWAITYLYVILLWVPFRSSDVSTTMTYYSRLFSVSSGIQWIHTASSMVLMAVFVWHLFYIRNNKWFLSFPAKNILSLSHLYPILIALVLIVLFAPLNTSPFIYFQF